MKVFLYSSPFLCDNSHPFAALKPKEILTLKRKGAEAPFLAHQVAQNQVVLLQPEGM